MKVLGTIRVAATSFEMAFHKAAEAAKNYPDRHDKDYCDTWPSYHEIHHIGTHLEVDDYHGDQLYYQFEVRTR
jgi:hypothetical protein